MLPSSYTCARAADFIGPARACAEFLHTRLVPALTECRAPKRLVFSGPPGVGKSQLAGFLLRALGGNIWNTTKFNGRQVKTEQVEALCQQFHFKDLFGAYRFVLVEELDTVPTDARSRLLTAVDEMPEGWLFAATTNKSKREFIAVHEATARRYEFMEIGPPTSEDVYALLSRRWPEAPECERRRIAVFWAGNVGGALNELDSYWLDGQPARLAA